MIQIYFLSILSNVLAGLILSAEHYSEKFPGFSAVKEFFSGKPGFRVGIGVISFLTGFLKLLTVTKGDVPVVGDLLPALTGLILGLGLLFERYKEKTTIPSKTIDKVDNLLLKHKSIYGSIGIVVAILHFLLPGIVLL
jgi:hypothetical protein